ncbi:MAG TPA: hypothetical protein VIH99_09380 [Bdellovibrionota bacterium]|jgi:hypothetical protein
MKWQKDGHFIEVLYAVFLAFCLVLLSSCAHDPKLEAKIQSERAAQPVVPPGPALQKESLMIIESAPLGEKEKAALKDIQESASADMQKLRDEEAQLRLLLIKQLVNPNASDREVEGIKKRILETSRKGDKRWLSALDEARKVIGRRDEQDAKFYRAFLQDPLPPE